MNTFTKLLGAAVLACAVGAHAAEPVLPQGTLRQGSLANQKLIQDATLAVVASVARKGCAKAERFIPYVVQDPTGNVGARTWQEKWVVEGCGKKFPVDIRFSEDGAKAANYTVLK